MKLVYIEKVGTTSNQRLLYNLIFSEGDVFNDEQVLYTPIGLSNFSPIYTAEIIEKSINTSIKLCLIQESMCHNFRHCIDKCVALAYEDLSSYEEYPQDGRLVLQYGMDYEDVEELLALKNIVLE